MTVNLGVLFIDGETDTHLNAANGQSLTVGDVTRDGVNRYKGAYSYSFPATATGNIKATNDADFNLGLNDFTIDCWFRKNITSGHNTFINIGSYGQDINYLLYYILDIGSEHLLNIIHPTKSITFNIKNVEPSGLFQNNMWYHIALTRSSGTLMCFLNGIMLECDTDDDLSTGDIKTESGYNTTIGSYGNTNNPFNGNMDNFRVVKGEALWTEDFNTASDASMFYTDPVPTSSIYNVGHRGTLRGKARVGFVRPTIKQFFTSKDFTEVLKAPTGYSENKCVNGVISASGGNLPEKAFNGDTSTAYLYWNSEAWNFNSLPEEAPWIQYQFTEAKQIEKLVMYNSNLTHGVEGVASFVLYGSNNGTDFVKITSGTRQDAAVSGGESFTFENSNSYLIYRFQTLFYGTVGGSGASLYELQLMEGIYE